MSSRVKKQVINTSILRGFVISSSMLSSVRYIEREKREKASEKRESGDRESARERERERERAGEKCV